MKALLKLGVPLNKKEQQQINGGMGCTIYTAAECNACDGFASPNGCCFGSAETWACLNLG